MEGEYREYLTDEQRSEAGCLGGRYIAVIVKRSTKVSLVSSGYPARSQPPIAT